MKLGYRVHNGKLWRRGFTTGTCAAAAAKAAAAFLLTGSLPLEVQVTLPGGEELQIPVTGGKSNGALAGAWVTKDGGDDPDRTHGAVIEAWVKSETQIAGGAGRPDIQITGGPGVGRVTKPGLVLPVGAPAINPIPLKMITAAVKQVVQDKFPVSVEIRVRDGEELARKTLNPRLGIIGGISILGTTGIVEPMSEDAFKTSLSPQIQVAQAQGAGGLVLTPGHLGYKQIVEQYGVPSKNVVLVSNFFGYMLEECARLQVKEVLLFGHIGKLVKLAGGIFHTHSRVANCRLEIVAAYAALLGASQETVGALLECITVEGALNLLEKNGLSSIFPLLASKAAEQAKAHVHNDLEVGVVFTNLQGQIIGWSPEALEIGGKLGWNFQSGL